MDQCVQLVENVFQQAGQGQTVNQSRRRIRLPAGYQHVMNAAVLGSGAVGLKAYVSGGGPSRSVVVLWDSESGALLAIMQAQRLGQVRTGAASGVATKYMARPDASTVGLFGTGNQAITQLEAVCAVRPVRQVRCYSRTPERRETFARRMASTLKLDVRPVSTADECVAGADIVIAITNSSEPVFNGEKLKPGAHVNAAGSNSWTRREVDEATVRRSSLVAVDDLPQAKVECGELIYAVERGIFRWEQAVELGEVVAGRVPGRSSDDAITLFESQGIATEDVVAALHVYSMARERGLGTELPA